MFRLAILISGRGSNMEAILDAVSTGTLQSEVTAVISNRRDAPGLAAAAARGIPVHSFPRQGISDTILETLRGKADLIVCAGFLSILKGPLLEEFRGRIINVHPALIPAFCGKGMYGLKVHEAALSYGVKVSGCTVHVVEEGVDSGPIILQKAVPVLEDDTPEQLQQRVLVKEHEALVEAVKLFSQGRVRIEERRVRIAPGGK